MIARLLISQSQKTRADAIEKELKKNNLAKNHPDLLYFEQDIKLGIAEARKIKEHFSFKPYSAKGRGVVLEDAQALTIEAQQALLKTLEELPENSLLILGANSDAYFLPTVLSRCQIIRIKNLEFRIKNRSEDIEKLLEATIQQKFIYIESLKEKEGFLSNLTAFFRSQLPANVIFLKELLQAEEWAKQNVNIRAILEYLMLKMPASPKRGEPSK